ncbi:hypothetical protein OIU84_015738 [Salix udensis]|uniref:Uncharacterized protein n=1 Tax=Salix udensis TaxID=889485 RepID=A0AAD6NPC9_9ROSI|nr:hypothetical protein OIU84_015738 [Salix udensis]
MELRPLIQTPRPSEGIPSSLSGIGAPRFRPQRCRHHSIVFPAIILSIRFRFMSPVHCFMLTKIWPASFLSSVYHSLYSSLTETSTSDALTCFSSSSLRLESSSDITTLRIPRQNSPYGENPKLARLEPRIFEDVSLGRELTIASLVVNSSLANSQLLTTKAGVIPILMEKIGPYLSAKAPNLKWGSSAPANKGR